MNIFKLFVGTCCLVRWHGESGAEVEQLKCVASTKEETLGETVREEKWIRTTFLSLYFADTLLQVHCSPLACSQISVC